MFNFPIHDTGNSVHVFYLQYCRLIFADVIVYIIFSSLAQESWLYMYEQTHYKSWKSYFQLFQAILKKILGSNFQI